MTRKNWTDEHVAHLRKWGGIKSAPQIAKDLGRTEASIYHKMQALKLKGIRKGDNHSQAKTTRVGAAMIKLLHANGYMPADIYHLFQKKPTKSIIHNICTGRTWKNTR